MQRLTLLGKMDLSPTSSKTRNLITSSNRYGLTSGSHSASTLRVTEDAKAALDPSSPPGAAREKRLLLSITKFDVFRELYERLIGKRLPDPAVMSDQLEQNGVAPGDAKKAADIFTANLRHIGLVREISGNEFVMSLDEVPDATPAPNPKVGKAATDEGSPEQVAPDPVPEDVNGAIGPALHLDLQIHIDSTATPEQIDKVFSSMAKYLYGRDV